VERYQDRPFALIGVNLDPQDPRSRQFQQDGSVTWRCFRDDSNDIGALYGVHTIPTVYVIDHKGVVRFKAHIAPSEKELDELIADAEAGRQ
jgi:hypothetical protein